MDRNVSGTVKSSLIVPVSSSVVMTVPGLTRLPTLTRRRPTRPVNAARTTVSASFACATRTRASLALSEASIWSSCASDSALVV